MGRSLTFIFVVRNEATERVSEGQLHKLCADSKKTRGADLALLLDLRERIFQPEKLA
jgi:hypothetical protein